MGGWGWAFVGMAALRVRTALFPNMVVKYIYIKLNDMMNRASIHLKFYTKKVVGAG